MRFSKALSCAILLAASVLQMQGQMYGSLSNSRTIIIRASKEKLQTPPRILSRFYKAGLPVERQFGKQRNSNDCSITSNLQVSYTGFTPQAQAAFEYAVGIWERCVVSNIPIKINAEFAKLGEGTLGSASVAFYHDDFTDAPQKDVWYPSALANSIAETDLNPSSVDINALFNSEYSWYYDPDGGASLSQHDFITVVLHEIGHGLGYTGSAISDGTAAGTYLLREDQPYVYDTFIENGGGTSILNYSNGSQALLNQLTSDNLFFDGPASRAANGNARARIYAPSAWNDGSSFHHLDIVFENTPNALMTFDLAEGETIHEIGPVGVAVLEDLGWTINDNCFPTYLYVNKNYQGVEQGTIIQPYKTLTKAHNEGPSGSTIFFLSSAIHNEGSPLLLNRKVLLKALNGGNTVIVQ